MGSQVTTMTKKLRSSPVNISKKSIDAGFYVLLRGLLEGGTPFMCYT